MAAIIPAVIAGVASADQQATAGKIRAIESQVEAQQIETAAAQREADRKERLSRAVTSQAARTGASGISFEGSPLSVIEEDMRREELATERDKFSSSMAGLQTLTRGDVAQRVASTGAALSLLSTASEAAQHVPKS